MKVSDLFPWRCVLCAGKSDQARDLCRFCQAALPWLELQSCCISCGMSLTAAQPSYCGQCLQHPPAISRCIAMWDYAAESAYLVQQLKFGQKLNFAKLMGDLLAETLQKAYQQEPWPQVMIAVPLHRKRLFERGFNQSLELAKVLQRQLTIPCDYRSALRLRHTPAQSLLPAAARRRNLHKAFSVQLTRPYQHVVIVDDVITTLSTAQELAKSLLAAGVKRVDVWSCIRTQDSKISRG